MEGVIEVALPGFGSDLKPGDRIRILDTFLLTYTKVVHHLSPYDAPCLGRNTWEVHFEDGTTLLPTDAIVSYEVL